MPRQRSKTPRYLFHKQSGRGRLVWTDALDTRHEQLLPGPFESDESLAAKNRLEAEILASPTMALRIEQQTVTVAMLLEAYMVHAERYYVDPDGKPTKELVGLKYAVKPVWENYAHTQAIQFGPLALKAVREKMIDAGLSRKLINRRIGAVKRIFKWAVSEELIPAATSDALWSVAGLEEGRSKAREAKPVGPIDDATVEATLPYLSTHVRAMIQLMRYTGMRPNEVCRMTLNQIERGTIWYYRPIRHKTAHRGIGRSIPLGPRA